MRRSDFDYKDSAKIQEFLNKIEFGTLIIPDTIPYAIPLSFCYEDSQIFLHGAKAGRKYTLLKTNPKVSFSCAKPYVYIPSSFLHHTMIPTQFFFSVFIEGQFCVVESKRNLDRILKQAREQILQDLENRKDKMDADTIQIMQALEGFHKD